MHIYVGNLPKNIDNAGLENLFKQYGTVESARVIHDRYTGESRGFGFVVMPNKNEADTAVQSLDGQDFQGSALRVNEARDREHKPRRNFRRYNNNK